MACNRLSVIPCKFINSTMFLPKKAPKSFRFSQLKQITRTMSSFEPKIPPPTADFTPDPSRSLALPPARQALLDDILALYACHPTVDRVKRYTPDCVYDDPFGYADNRYKVAAQWFALPKLFSDSETLRYEVVRNDEDLIQFKSEQKWTFRLPVPINLKSVTMKGFISLALDPATVHDEFIRVKYHKDQASEQDYKHEGILFNLKKWQADAVPKYISAEEVQIFKKDDVSAKDQ